MARSKQPRPQIGSKGISNPRLGGRSIERAAGAGRLRRAAPIQERTTPAVNPFCASSWPDDA